MLCVRAGRQPRAAAAGAEMLCDAVAIACGAGAAISRDVRQPWAATVLHDRQLHGLVCNVQQLQPVSSMLGWSPLAICPIPCPQLWLLGSAPPPLLLVLLLLASGGVAMNAALLHGCRGKAPQLAAAWQLWRGVLGAVGFAVLPQVRLQPSWMPKGCSGSRTGCAATNVGCSQLLEPLPLPLHCRCFICLSSCPRVACPTGRQPVQAGPLPQPASACLPA